MSVMSARKRPRRLGVSNKAEDRQSRAYRHIAETASRAGDEDRAKQMITMSNYWQARAMCKRDKTIAVNGAVISVSLDRS